MTNRSGRPRKTLGDFCDNGHELTPTNHYATKTGIGCLTCKRAVAVASAAKAKKRADDKETRRRGAIENAIEDVGWAEWENAGAPCGGEFLRPV